VKKVRKKRPSKRFDKGEGPGYFLSLWRLSPDFKRRFSITV
jgi:hypothetical protein